MISIGSNFRFFTKQHREHGVKVSSLLSLAVSFPIFGISSRELSKNEDISSLQGPKLEAGHGALKGVLSQASRISMADSGDVDMPETASTLQLLMERVLIASAVERQVEAKTPGNLLAKMETPTPVPQATRPRI